MFELVHHPIRCSDQSIHEGAHHYTQDLFAAGADNAAQFNLEIPVRGFDRDDLGRLRRQIKDFDPITALVQSSGYELDMVYCLII